MTATTPALELEEQPDPRRWFAAAVAIFSVFIPVLDNTVLNVAIPAILREFRTDLPSLQWVITGYSLTFATLLIIGGRLGDIYGHRRMFILGATIFAAGSALASVSQSVPTLFLGEALIEGIGASMMIPATLSILSTTFRGPERAKAFAAWGAVAGAAVAFGPIVGGFLTTEYSWRWALRINVIVAPVIVLGALLFMHRDVRSEHKPRIDVPGALMIGLGSFALIFGLSEGATYGWWRPVQDLTIAGHALWPASRPISMIPFAFVVAALVLMSFVRYELAKERRHGDPLFEFSQLRHLGFRYGLLTTMVLAMGQFGLLFVIPVLLEDGAHFSALRTGAWMVPMGVLIALGAPIGGRMTRVIGTTAIVRCGLALEAIGLAAVALAVRPQPDFWTLAPGMVVFGLGVGFASSQLTNVILSDIEPDKTGVASGANTTVRQVGLALGIATFASLLNVQTIRNAVDAVRESNLAAGLKASTILRLHSQGVNFAPATGTSHSDATTLSHLIATAVADGARPALLFAAAVVTAGTLLSFLIPSVRPMRVAEAPQIEMIDAYENIDLDPGSFV